MSRRRRDDEVLYLAWMFLAVCIAAACMMLVTSCASPEVLRERPLVTIYAAMNGNLVRNQSKTTKIFPLADGMLCLTPQDMEKLVQACVDPTVPAR